MPSTKAHRHDSAPPPKRRVPRHDGDLLFDADLSDLLQAMRWREWMRRVEAAIFCSPSPVSREALAKLVRRDCNFDELICDIRLDFRARPYELVLVAGGYHLRTKARLRCQTVHRTRPDYQRVSLQLSNLDLLCCGWPSEVGVAVKQHARPKWANAVIQGLRAFLTGAIIMTF